MGFNDTWQIKNIDLFPNAEVFILQDGENLCSILKTYLQIPWNGTYEGALLPTDSISLCFTS